MAAALLAGLPSRGLISAERPSLRGAPAVYVSVTDTSPPPGQEITTDTTHILVRALAVKKAREEKKATNEEAAAKRQKLAAELEGGPPLTAELVRTFTIDKLKVSLLGGAVQLALASRGGLVRRALTPPFLSQAALKQRGLVQSGVKDVLIERLIASLNKAAAATAGAAGPAAGAACGSEAPK